MIVYFQSKKNEFQWNKKFEQLKVAAIIAYDLLLYM